VRVELDLSEGRGGDKMWSWVKKGVPLFLEVGPRDVAGDSVFVGRRDRMDQKRYGAPRSEFVAALPGLLDEIQKGLFDRAQALREQNTVTIDNKKDFYDYFTPKNTAHPEIHGGFALCRWSGDPAVGEQVKNDLGVTIRCIPLDAPKDPGPCMFTGKPADRRVIFAKAY
jgi:prolyl-tRNA synthetase